MRNITIQVLNALRDSKFTNTEIADEIILRCEQQRIKAIQEFKMEEKEVIPKSNITSQF